MKVSYHAAAHTNSILNAIESSTKAFTSTPEIFCAEFWEFVLERAKNIDYAQSTLIEIDNMASEGITISPFVASNVATVMHVARQTLRNAEMKRFM